MKARAFGGTDLRVSEFGLGCARIGGIFQGDTAGHLDLLAAARDAGINFFDTADMYSQGESEVLLGRAFRGVRDRVVIASKAGYCLPAQRRVVARVKPLLRPLIRLLGIKRSTLPQAIRGAPSQNFSPSYLVGAVEGSLRRLGTDYIDLLQLHSPPAEVVERGDWVEPLERLKTAGKIRHYGVSCDTIESGLAALRVGGVASLQIVVNLLERAAADALLPGALDRGVAVIARECLANGLLIRPPGDVDLAAYSSSPEQAARRAVELDGLRQQASASGKTLARRALEHASGLAGVSVTLIGVRNLQQLRSTLESIPA